MGTEDRPDFTVVDRRRTGGAEPEATADSHADADGAPGQADAAARGAATDVEHETTDVEHETTDAEAGLPALAMRDRLLMCIDILGQGAWIAMGLVADPATREIQKDLPACQKAIDAVAFLAEQVEGDLDDSVRRDLKNLVSDLRINYVQQKSR